MDVLTFTQAKRITYRLNNVVNPPLLNREWFDDIVVSTEYIGPISKP